MLVDLLMSVVVYVFVVLVDASWPFGPWSVAQPLLAAALPLALALWAVVRSRRAGRDLVLAVASLAWAAAIACASVFWIVLMYLDLLSRQS